jgi:beta-N-acetylhexosaminidase
LLLLLTVFLLNSSRLGSVEAQDAVEEHELDPTVEAIFETLTPTERVGQLFMVSFKGNDVAADSAMAELIQTYRIGGVFISTQNENFTNDETTPTQILTLINRLQAMAQELPAVVTSGATITNTLTPTSTLTSPTLTDTVSISYTPIPLFVAANHEGGGFPYAQIRGGLTDIPNQMALGATWDTEAARLVGEVTGHELSLLGITMLLGPSLDVLDNPRLDLGNSLGTRTFGGHPYWVGEMGQAYIRGVHQGSNGKILTIAKHFPGFGSSDREINQGVPTILKSLADLRRVELLPFFQVTQLNPDDVEGTTDGLMTAHVRYQGLQGNVPISLDARNLPAILASTEILPWRDAGGLVVSAPLGVPAALEGVVTSKENFPARRLAQDAFLAGSEILFLDDFAFEGDDATAEVVNMKDAIEFFQEKYTSDPNFQTAVDRAVRRIIKAKIKIGGKELLNVPTQQSEDNLTNLGSIPLDLDQIAQTAVTLIIPPAQEGLNPLADPPQPDDNILIFTDDRLDKDCPNCPEFPLISTTALEETLLQLFGPPATGQVSPDQIDSLSFLDLKDVVSDEDLGGNENTEVLIEAADWIIFAMFNIDPEANPQSDAVRALLRSRFDTVRNKNLVLFAFNAPYFLDETESSQLTAYYAFYDKTPDFLEAAAKLLFQQFEPTGASPVSIPAIGPLDLSPNPEQIIELEPIHKIDIDDNIIALEESLENGATIDLELGEGILFRSGVIVDRNGHRVPDGTLVDFFRFYPLEGLALGPLQSKTVHGVAEIVIIKERDTPLQVTASSNLAVQSVTFNIGPGIVDTPTPTVTLTPTPTDTPSPTPTSTATATSTPTPTASPTIEITPSPTPLPPPPPPPPRPVNIVDLAYSLLGMMLIGGIAFTLGGERFALEERVRAALVAIAVGLVGYSSYTIMAMTFPAYIRDILQGSPVGPWAATLVSLAFAIGGVLIWHLKPGRIFWKRAN